MSQAVLLGAILLIGPSPFAVLLFELMHVWVAFMAHANVRVPDRIERLARLVIVTPDMHRIHHSTVTAEATSNNGGLVSWWDRIFRNYRPQPAVGHDRMTIGLAAFRDDRELTFLRLLMLPFVREQKRPSRANEIASRILDLVRRPAAGHANDIHQDYVAYGWSQFTVLVASGARQALK